VSTEKIQVENRNNINKRSQKFLVLTAWAKENSGLPFSNFPPSGKATASRGGLFNSNAQGIIVKNATSAMTKKHICQP
jgi:hypothetical protein